MSSDGLADHLNRGGVDVSGTMLRLPGVTSSDRAPCPAFGAQLGAEEGEHVRMHRGTPGNDETDLSRGEDAHSSAECNPRRQNICPSSGPSTGLIDCDVTRLFLKGGNDSLRM